MDLIHRVAFVAVVALGSSAALAEKTPAEDTTAESPQATETLDVETILANPLTEEDYRETKDCIWNRQIDSIEILDEDLVVFRSRVGGKIWLNKLANTCHGLRRDMMPITGNRNASVCRMSQMAAQAAIALAFRRARALLARQIRGHRRGAARSTEARHQGTRQIGYADRANPGRLARISPRAKMTGRRGLGPDACKASWRRLASPIRRSLDCV